MNAIESLAVLVGVVALCVASQCAINIVATIRTRYLNRYYRRTRKALHNDHHI